MRQYALNNWEPTKTFQKAEINNLWLQDPNSNQIHR